MPEIQIKDLLGDWLLTVDVPGERAQILFNSYQNALLVKNVLEWERAHPNAAVPYLPHGAAEMAATPLESL